MKRLQDILDSKNLNKLIDEFGGQRIWIPKRGNRGYRSSEDTSIRNQKLKSLRRRGKGVKELSKMFCISPTRIYDVTRPESLHESA